MSQDQTSETDGRVVPLRRRATSAPPPISKDRDPPDLSRYERAEDEHDDYRHRMLVNAAAFSFVVLLVVGGVWLANTIATMRKNQDCVLSGRRGCTPVETPSADR